MYDLKRTYQDLIQHVANLSCDTSFQCKHIQTQYCKSLVYPKLFSFNKNEARLYIADKNLCCDASFQCRYIQTEQLCLNCCPKDTMFENGDDC